MHSAKDSCPNHLNQKASNLTVVEWNPHVSDEMTYLSKLSSPDIWQYLWLAFSVPVYPCSC